MVLPETSHLDTLIGGIMPKLIDILDEKANVLGVDFGQLSDDQKEELAQYLLELDGDIATKTDNVVRYIRKEEAYAKACREEAERLMNKAKAAENRVKFLKGYHLYTMEQHGLQYVVGKVYSMRQRITKVVNIVDEKLVPEKWYKLKTTRTLAKFDMLDALNKGEKIPGVTLGESVTLICK